jgi:DNA polymerase (family 10)
MAKDLGVKIAISTDAHRVDHLRMMRYGVGQARRGWLTSEDVINTRSWSDLVDILKR